MKKFAVLIVALFSFMLSFSQDTIVTTVPVDTMPTVDRPTPQRWNAANINNRSKDHLLIQLGYAGWAQKPDSIMTKGIARAFNIYFMFDFPFKTSPKLSVGIGAGISTSNIYFDKTMIDIAGKNSNELRFQDVSDTSNFKKYKFLTTYLEAPVELRYTANPYNPARSWKFAIGGKIGTLLAASTKGKNLQNSGGQSILNYTLKEKSKRFINSTRLSATARVGYGNFSLFGSYQINSFVKEGFGPDIRPYMIGLTLSGL